MFPHIMDLWEQDSNLVPVRCFALALFPHQHLKHIITDQQIITRSYQYYYYDVAQEDICVQVVVLHTRLLLLSRYNLHKSLILWERSQTQNTTWIIVCFSHRIHVLHRF